MFTTADKIKLHLWGSTTSTQYDTLFAQLLLMVDDMITTETGVATGATITTYTDEIINSRGRTQIRTKHHPIGTLTKLERRDANNEWETYSGVYEDIAEGEIEADGNYIYTRYVVAPEGRRNIRLTYTAGYTDATVPDDLALCATLMACALFNGRSMVGLASQNMLGLQQVMSPTEYLYITSTLKKYKQVYAL
jgi:hypothetical protein